MTPAKPSKQTARGRLRPVPEPDQQPPHNQEAEEAVLGAVLTAGRLLDEVAAVLEEADFYRPAHRAIWRAVLRLADRNQPTDPVTVLGELDHSGELADVGGGPFLHTLVEAVPTVANASHYAQLVAETARRRRVIDLGIRLAHSDADPAVLAHLASELADTTTAHGGRGWAPPAPFGATGSLPVFPVEVLPDWLGEYVAAVATATQTPPDLAGMLALAVLATVTAGAVEVEARLAGAAVPVRGRGHGRRHPQEQRVHCPHPAGRRVRAPAGCGRPSVDHRDGGPAPHRRPSRRPR
jgi:replicative DNA helicase